MRLTRDQIERAERAAFESMRAALASARLPPDNRGGGQRFDANETAFLERELTQLRSKLFEVKFQDLEARRFLPMATDIDPSAETYTYKVFKRVGRARIGGNLADDAPRIDLDAFEVTGKVRNITGAYGWDLLEMRNAARTGVPLQSYKARYTREAIETAIDEMLAFGDLAASTGQAESVVTGLLNNADSVSAGIINPGNDPWSSASAANIVDDLNTIVSTYLTGTAQTIKPDSMLLAPAEFNLIAQKPMSQDNPMTVLRYFLQNNPWIKNVDPWVRSTGSGAGSTNRGVIYRRDSMILEGVVPQEFEQFPPQLRNLEWLVNCLARCGGVKIYHPNAVRYIDFA